MNWGVLSRFRRYVEASEGEISVEGGASRHGDEFVFPIEHTVTDGAVLGFSGSVHFRAHGGLLDLAIRNPRISWQVGEMGMVDVAARGMTRTDFAIVTRVEHVDSHSMTVRTKLTLEGVHLLGNVYPKDLELDPIRILSGNPPAEIR